MMLCYLTMMMNLSPSLSVAEIPAPTPNMGVFGTATFVGPLVGAITNVATLSLFVYAFGAVSGGHVNPMVTIATFLCRLTTLPRMLLYIGFQTGSATLAGLLVRASTGTRDFKVGGCWVDSELVNARQQFTVEWVSGLGLMFLIFDVGLDPRQASTFRPALGPVLVGLSLGFVGFTTSFAVPGYGGASMNPARCFATFVRSTGNGFTSVSKLSPQGSSESRQWILRIAPIIAAVVHAIFYTLIPPWSPNGQSKLKSSKKVRVKMVDQRA